MSMGISDGDATKICPALPSDRHKKQNNDSFPEQQRGHALPGESGAGSEAAADGNDILAGDVPRLYIASSGVPPHASSIGASNRYYCEDVSSLDEEYDADDERPTGNLFLSFDDDDEDDEDDDNDNNNNNSTSTSARSSTSTISDLRAWFDMPSSSSSEPEPEHYSEYDDDSGYADFDSDSDGWAWGWASGPELDEVIALVEGTLDELPQGEFEALMGLDTEGDDGDGGESEWVDSEGETGSEGEEREDEEEEEDMLAVGGYFGAGVLDPEWRNAVA